MGEKINRKEKSRTGTKFQEMPNFQIITYFDSKIICVETSKSQCKKSQSILDNKKEIHFACSGSYFGREKKVKKNKTM